MLCVNQSEGPRKAMLKLKMNEGSGTGLAGPRTLFLSILSSPTLPAHGTHFQALKTLPQDNRLGTSLAFDSFYQRSFVFQLLASCLIPDWAQSKGKSSSEARNWGKSLLIQRRHKHLLGDIPMHVTLPFFFLDEMNM